MAQEIQGRGGSEVRVLNPTKLPFIWDTPTKTDKEDAMKLTYLIEERQDNKRPIVPLLNEQEMDGGKSQGVEPDTITEHPTLLVCVLGVPDHHEEKPVDIWIGCRRLLKS
jgi:hypothetical protein